MSKKERENKPAWHHVTENVECLAVAIIMALILKFYLIEAYKIPTGSMQPTIMGNAERGLFDRVLVNKFIYLFRKPERWDVIVFKYPLDQSKNYIKRLIGLPGEKVSIQYGDIYINDRIERKPESAIYAVLKEIYPNKGQNGAFRNFFETRGDVKITDDGTAVCASKSQISTKQPITANYLDGYDPDYKIPKPKLYFNEKQSVGDVRLAFEVTLENGAEGIEARIEEEGNIHQLFLEAEGSANPSRIESSRAQGEAPWSDPEVVLEPKRSYEVLFSHIDDRLTLHLDGELLAQYDYEVSKPKSGNHTTQIAFGPRGGAATFEQIRVARDIYYISGRKNEKPVSFDIPPGHYFALGDNTQNSADSRLWLSTVFNMNNGEVVKGNYEPGHNRFGLGDANPTRTPNAYILTDMYGDKVVLPLSEINGAKYRSIPENFIPEKLMLGKAMVIFWPIVPHFRWKLLR